MSTAEISVAESKPKGLLDRFLSLFSAVRPGEGGSALLLALNIFLLLAAYYVLKTVREALILAEAGAEVKSYSAAGQALLFLLVVPAYGAFASRVNRIRLISWVTLFFISHLGLFFLLARAGMQVGVAFYLWLGVFNMLVVAQFWAFANDLYTEEQGKRLFPIVGVGASVGAWVGSVSAEKLFDVLPPVSAPSVMMLIGAVVLGVCVLLSIVVDRRESGRSGAEQTAKAREPLAREGGFELVRKNRYLLLIAIFVLMLNLVNTIGEFLLGKLVVTEAIEQIGAGDELARERGAFIGRFFGDFFGWVNLTGVLIQMFLVSRIFRFIGVRGALFIVPCIALGGYGVLLAFPLLAVVRYAKILENGADYSLQNTTRHALFLPTSREAKYKAKAATDTFFVRIGDTLQAVVVFAGTMMAFGIRSFALVNLVFVLIWLSVVVLLYREHKKIAPKQA